MSCFYHVDHFPPLPAKFIDPVFTTEWVYPEPEIPGEKTIRIVHSPSDFYKTKLCYDLFKEFGTVKTEYFKNEPMSYYDWHQDIKRNCGINFLLNDVVDALTLYMFKGTVRLNGTIENVRPKLYRPVLLDTTIRHCVINYSNTTRYILSIGLHDEAVTFADVQRFLEQYPVSENMYK
jgi:hypothetical protein